MCIYPVPCPLFHVFSLSGMGRKALLQDCRAQQSHILFSATSSSSSNRFYGYSRSPQRPLPLQSWKRSQTYHSPFSRILFLFHSNLDHSVHPFLGVFSRYIALAHSLCPVWLLFLALFSLSYILYPFSHPFHLICRFIRPSLSLNLRFQSKSSKCFIHAILSRHQIYKKQCQKTQQLSFHLKFLFLSAVWGQHRCFFKGEKKNVTSIPLQRHIKPPAEIHSQTWSVVTFLGDDRERQPTPLAMDFNRHDVHSKTGPVQWVTGQRSMTEEAANSSPSLLTQAAVSVHKYSFMTTLQGLLLNSASSLNDFYLSQIVKCCCHFFLHTALLYFLYFIILHFILSWGGGK